MVSTRSSRKQAVVDNRQYKQVIKQQTKKPNAPKHNVGGRHPEHDLRSLIGIGIKIAIPGATLKMAVDMVNEVCDNITNSMHPAAQEGKLCKQTLKNRCADLMHVVWAKIQSDKEKYSRAHWRKLVLSRGTETFDSIYELTGQACDRIVIAKNSSKISLNTRLPTNYVIDWNAYANHMVITNNWVPVNNWVQLEPQPQAPLWYASALAPVQLGSGNQVPQTEDIHGFNMSRNAAMHNDTFEINSFNFDLIDESPGSLQVEHCDDIFGDVE